MNVLLFIVRFADKGANVISWSLDLAKIDIESLMSWVLLKSREEKLDTYICSSTLSLMLLRHTNAF